MGFMKPRKKDNLTDAVEALERHDDDAEPKAGNQQVVDNEGEIITLGQHKPTPPNKNKVVELSPEIIEEIKKIVASALEQALSKFVSKNARKTSK